MGKFQAILKGNFGMRLSYFEMTEILDFEIASPDKFFLRLSPGIWDTLTTHWQERRDNVKGESIFEHWRNAWGPSSDRAPAPVRQFR